MVPRERAALGRAGRNTMGVRDPRANADLTALPDRPREMQGGRGIDPVSDPAGLDLRDAWAGRGKLESDEEGPRRTPRHRVEACRLAPPSPKRLLPERKSSRSWMAPIPSRSRPRDPPRAFEGPVELPRGYSPPACSTRNAILVPESGSICSFPESRTQRWAPRAIVLPKDTLSLDEWHEIRQIWRVDFNPPPQ